eukprot:7085666-Prymnesium_polylepis.1
MRKTAARCSMGMSCGSASHRHESSSTQCETTSGCAASSADAIRWMCGEQQSVRACRRLKRAMACSMSRACSATSTRSPSSRAATTAAPSAAVPDADGCGSA